MTKSLRLRLLTILAAVLISFFYLMPTLFEGQLPEWWTKYLSSEQLHVGLDLQGGAHFLLEVKSEKAIENAADRVIEDLESNLKEKRIKFLDIARLNKDSSEITVELRSADDDSAFNQVLSEGGLFDNVKILNTEQENGGINYVLDFTDARKVSIKRNSIDQAVETIRNRIDQFGVSEPIVQKHGNEEILIQLPGLKDIKRAKALIGKTAQLQFKLLDEENSLNDAKKNGAPRGSEILVQKTKDKKTGVVNTHEMLVKSKAILTGEYLKDARVSSGQQSAGVEVIMELDSQGAKIFAKLTEENIGKRLAIVLDDNVYSAPVIREKIPNGTASITGSFNWNEARDLVIILKAGSLPAPIEFLEERSVGPSLGAELIEKGKFSLMIGGLLVIAFMIIYYKFSGVIANFALILNVFLIFGGLAAFGATLTLPGLAGIILTIGMAVDSNVLIFERIREEKRLNKTPRASLDAGYSKALSSILDANITTMITGLILFQFGTGPVKGFAVTLCLGILASLFTSVFVSRVFFDLIFEKKIFKEISI